VREIARRIGEWLSPELGPRPLVFDDEPDITYYAVVEKTDFLDQTDKRVKTKITFNCPDPYGKGTEEKFIIKAADTIFSRNTPASSPKSGNFKRKNEPRSVWINEEELLYKTIEQEFYDNQSLSVLMDTKLLIEEGTKNLVKDPGFFSASDIGTTGAAWKWIVQPNAAKNEVAWKISTDIMKNYSGWHTFTCKCNGTERLGIRQEITGWQNDNRITLSGRLATSNYKSGKLNFDISGETAGGVEIFRSQGNIVAKECFDFISVDYEYLIETINVPIGVEKVFINIYATNNPVFTMHAAYIQLEQKGYATSFIADPDKDTMPGETLPLMDDTTQYTRLPEVIKWPGPQVVNTQEGFMSLWVFPIRPLQSGVNFFSAGDGLTAGGNPYSTFGVHNANGSVQAVVGTGSGFYNVALPATKLLVGQWNFLCMNWKAFDTLDFYINGEKVSVNTADINLSKPSGDYGYLMSDQAGAGQMTCIIDNFYVRSKKVDPGDLEEILYNLEHGLAANLGVGIDTFTCYNLNMQDIFGGTWADPVRPLKSPLNTLFARVGTGPAYPIFEVDFFSDATFFNITHYETQRKIVVNYNFTKGDFLIIDCARQLIKINGLDSMGALDISSDFFALHQGINNIVVPDVCPATVIIKYQPNYI
jgi:phage-related protein